MKFQKIFVNDLFEDKVKKSKIYKFLSVEEQLILEMELGLMKGKITQAQVKKSARKHKIPLNQAVTFINHKIKEYKINKEIIDTINLEAIKDINQEIEQIGKKYKINRKLYGHIFN